MRWQVLLVILLLSACGNQITGNVVRDTGPKQVLIIVSGDDYRHNDVDSVSESIRSAGHEVTVAGVGVVIGVDINLSDLAVSDYDMVVLMTGALSDEALAALRLAQATGKIVAADRLAPVVLAKAGMLSGRTATVFPSDDAIAALEDGGAAYTSEPIARDHGIITASGVRPSQDFGSALVDALGG